MLTSQAFSVLLFGFLAAMAHADHGGAEVRFALCAERVASVEVVAPRTRLPAWSVVVQLTPEAAGEFAALTRAHVGDVLEVTAGDAVFVRATVQGTIRSGSIGHTGYESEAEARAARDAVATAGACSAS